MGIFIGDNWQEWNGHVRDDVRHVLKGDAGLARSVSQRLIGSPDIDGHKQREAEANVNVITCHDGSDNNASWNCGVEGPTEDAENLALHSRQSRNLMTILLLSIGTPMLAMGDEIDRSQQGNNNTYAQDNSLNWLDCTLLERNTDLHRYVRKLIAHRGRRDVVSNKSKLTLYNLV